MSLTQTAWDAVTSNLSEHQILQQRFNTMHFIEYCIASVVKQYKTSNITPTEFYDNNA